MAADMELEFEITGTGNGIMSITHDGRQRLAAKWVTGDSVPVKFSGPCWTDDG